MPKWTTAAFSYFKDNDIAYPHEVIGSNESTLGNKIFGVGGGLGDLCPS